MFVPLPKDRSFVGEVVLSLGDRRGGSAGNVRHAAGANAWAGADHQAVAGRSGDLGGGVRLGELLVDSVGRRVLLAGRAGDGPLRYQEGADTGFGGARSLGDRHGARHGHRGAISHPDLGARLGARRTLRH